MVMDRLELQKLRDLPIEGVAERLGLEVKKHKCLCPFHNDHHASMSFKVSRNTYRCFVCGASGGPIDLVMRYLHLDFKEACRWLQTLSGSPCLGHVGRGLHRHVPRPRRAWRTVVHAVARDTAQPRSPPVAAKLQGLQRLLPALPSLNLRFTVTNPPL